MGTIISVFNQKGGVGKTTTNVNLSACLASLGKKILVIDIDPQGNTTSGFGVNKTNISFSIYDALINGVNIKEIIQGTNVEKLDIVPSNTELAGAEIELTDVKNRELTLKNSLEPVKDDYDFIFVDCPPSLGLLTINALVSSDSVIIPIQCEYYALEGVSQLMNTIKLVKSSLNPNLEIQGVVLSMFDGRTNLSIQVVDEVKKFFRGKVYTTIIPRNVRLAEAPSYGLPIIDYDAKSKGAEAYMELANEFLEYIEEWLFVSVKKRGLGKGLSALIPDEPLIDIAETESNDERIHFIDISLIEPNREQPRKDFDEDTLGELVKSVQRHGVIQPIIVRRRKDGYEIVAGERRWRAARKAGLNEIPALIKELNLAEVTQIALIENIQRENLNAIEEAMAYKNLSERYKLTQEEISQAVGKSRSYISNIMRLLNLEDEIIELIVEGSISSGHGRTLLSVEDRDARLHLSQAIIKNNLSVRETEKLVKKFLDENGKKTSDNKSKQKAKDPIILEIEESLRKVFGTKVLISKGRKKGKIEIEYYNEDDLERILELLSK